MELVSKPETIPQALYTTLLTNLPPLVVEEIFRRLPPKSVWKLRILSKSFLSLLSSDSFVRMNLAHFVQRPHLAVPEAEIRTADDRFFLQAPQIYQTVYIRYQWAHLSTMVWRLDVRCPFPFGLNIAIPAALMECRKLEVLTIVGQGLVGVIPEEIAHLENLVSLNLSENRLSGEIPRSIGSLKRLKELKLSENPLSGTIPCEIGLLSSLVHLSLRSNEKLGGRLRPEMGNLGNLQVLNLSSNKMEGPIPPEWGNLASLRQLSLSRITGLSGPIPSPLGNLTRLKRLRIFKLQCFWIVFLD
ncbi:hypothetical protein HDU98_003155 [Podochytrium sp. JEL0797]|nr:hypothetical protein HDU98_003155 [Podochytrium sp. JEL0797]